MNASRTPSGSTAPVKDKPHAYEPGPEVPMVYPRAGTMVQQGTPTQGMDLPKTIAPNCVVCGLPANDRVHVESEEVADAESPRWGL